MNHDVIQGDARKLFALSLSFSKLAIRLIVYPIFSSQRELLPKKSPNFNAN